MVGVAVGVVVTLKKHSLQTCTNIDNDPTVASHNKVNPMPRPNSDKYGRSISTPCPTNQSHKKSIKNHARIIIATISL